MAEANERGFFDIFKRYSPSEEKRTLLLHAKNPKLRMTKKPEPLRVEIELDFPTHEDAELIYEVEDECRALYEAESFKILPHFPPESFREQYFAEIVTEATLCGAVTQGFFSDCTYSDDGETVSIGIPFFDGGIDFLNRSETTEILSRILQSRYGLQKKFRLISSTERAEARSAQWEKQKTELLASAEEAQKQAFFREREQMAAEREAEARAADPHYGFEKKVGISAATGNNKTESDGIFRRGATVYDTTSAEQVWGDDFAVGDPVPLSDVEKAKGNVVFLGTVFEVELKESRGGDKTTLTVGITDGASAVFCKRSVPNEEIDFAASLNKDYNEKHKTIHFAAYGKALQDKFDNEYFVSLRGLKKISVKKRTDDAPRKRVELHLHTNMSQMDGLSVPADVVDTAIRWGHPAIAVTDHGNVQAFPEMMLAKEKAKDSDLKILYGIEGYFVNDTARCLFGTEYPAFDGEMVVFDIETTGLSNRTCKIIEIGAVLVSHGEIVDKMDIFVDPECPIPPEITELTSITDEMVAGAQKEKEAVEAFLAFAGDRMLVAHNANFDVGFIRVACERHHLPFKNTYLDTVGLSKYINPELKNHKLDTVAEYYKLNDFHHHRASDDAEVLAGILLCMIERLRAEGIGDFDRMMETMSEKSDPLKLPTYHIILFAKNKEGLKNLYKLISFSYLNYYKRFPRMPKSVIEQYREGLIIGSACEAGELFRAILDGRSEQEIESIASFYDYLEIQPIDNNRFLLDEGRVAGEEGLRDLNRQIYALGKKLGKPVCATCDSHFIDREDEVYRRILMAGMKYPDADRAVPLYLRTTEEMLEEFSYLGKEAAEEVVIDNTNAIADMCDAIRPIPEGRYEPSLPGAVEELRDSCWKRAHDWYGDELPEIVESRLSKELDSIIGHGFAVLYMIAVRLVAYSESLGYQVGSRGSVGSSFVATMSGISEVNPLKPHYRCPKCRYSEFFTDGSVGSGFDLPDKKCPKCGADLIMDGHDIPFETFLGFFGEKSPDIDLNFSGDVQGKVHKYTEELFGEGHVFRAGTIGTLAQKTAWGYVSKYIEERKIALPKAEIAALAARMVGIKRTTGQHPGGIIVIPKEFDVYEFTPIQHPADDPSSDVITTHFQYSYLHETILKLDELGHDMPTKYKMLEKYTNTSVLDVKMNDRSVYQLFSSTASLGVSPADIGGIQLGTLGIPEMGTRFLQQVLIDAKPETFADLLQISGLTHGTGVWLGNAQDLIRDGTCKISEVVGTRDSIMLYLLRHELPADMSFKIMEDVRKGKGLKPEYEAAMVEHGVPEWYIGSCKKIKYMFPKAHAAAYVMSAIRLCWYKIYYPMEFYAGFFTVAPAGFDAEIVGGGASSVAKAIKDIEEKGMDASQKEEELLATLQLVREALARGVVFLPVDLKRSDATAFLPENGKIRMPFNALPGLGDTAAQKIVEAREKYDIWSVEDLRQRTGISKTVIEILRRNHVLDNMNETNQFSFF